MGFYFGTIGEIIRKSLNAGYLLNIIFVMLLSIVLIGVSIAIVAFPAILLIASVIGTGFSLTTLIILAVLAVVFFLLMALVQAVSSGIALHIAKQYYSNESISFGKAWGNAKPRIMALFKVNFIVSILVLIVVLILAFPLILSIISLAKAGSSLNFAQGIGAVLSIIGSALLSIFLIFLFFLIFLPFFYLINQTALFENASAIGSIRIAWHYARKNYFMNWIMAVLFILFIMILFGIVFFIRINLGPLGFVLELIFSVWSGALSYLFYFKLYQINAERG